MKKSTFPLAAFAALAVGFWIPPGIRALTQSTEPGQAFATWRYPGVSLQQMTQDADVIATVTPTAAYPGRVATSQLGESSHEFELVDFAVNHIVKGTPQPQRNTSSPATERRRATRSTEMASCFSQYV